MYGHDAESGAGNDGDDSFPFVCMYVSASDVRTDGMDGEMTMMRRDAAAAISFLYSLTVPCSYFRKAGKATTG